MTDLLWPGDHRAGPLLTDAALLAAMVRVEQTWLATLHAHGLAPSAPDLSDLAGPADLPALAEQAESGGNPVIPLLSLLRSRLATRDEPASHALHAGLTSQDVLDTALTLTLREAATQIREDLTTQITALAALADRHRHTPMAGRTLTQHAIPITFGLKAATWLTAVLDAQAALTRAADLPIQLAGAAGSLAAPTALAARIADPPQPDPSPAASSSPSSRPDPSPPPDPSSRLGRSSPPPLDQSSRPLPDLSSPPGAGASASGRADAARLAVALVRETAAALGLPYRGPWQTARAPFTTFADALVTCTDAWGRIAADVLLGSRPEIGELTEAPTEGRGGSSAMPNKHNPILSVLIRRAALAAPQLAATLHTAAATYVDERPDGAWHVEWPTLRTLTRRTVAAASHTAELLTGLQVNPDRMAATLASARPGIDAEQRKYRAELPYDGATSLFIDAALARAAESAC